MVTAVILVIVPIGVGVIVSILTYFINRWLDRHFDK